MSNSRTTTGPTTLSAEFIIMVDAATFSKELSKYKVVRTEDFCRSRAKQRSAVVVAKSAAPAAVTASTAAGVGMKLDATKKETNNFSRGNGSFWTTFENVLAENNALTTREITNLINTMKKCEREFVRSVNLDDLEAAASSIQTKN